MVSRSNSATPSLGVVNLLTVSGRSKNKKAKVKKAEEKWPKCRRCYCSLHRPNSLDRMHDWGLKIYAKSSIRSILVSYISLLKMNSISRKQKLGMYCSGGTSTEKGKDTRIFVSVPSEEWNDQVWSIDHSWMESPDIVLISKLKMNSNPKILDCYLFQWADADIIRTTYVFAKPMIQNIVTIEGQTFPKCSIC